MAQVLPSDLTFAALRDRLCGLGWAEDRIPALLPPLIPGEPETAAFVKADTRLDYHFNPALRLRVLNGPVPEGLPSIAPDDLPGMIRAPDPETALLGASAAAALGQGALRTLIMLRSLRLPRDLAPLALSAAHNLAPLCAEARGFAALPPERQQRTLRLALKHRSPDTADLALMALSAGPDVAATAMIAAARLGLTDLLPAFPRQASGEVHVAIRKLATETLKGAAPGAEVTPRNRFWRALLGQGDPDMDLRLAPLVEPAPDPLPHLQIGGLDFRRVAAVPHWLGDPKLPASAHRHTPESFLIAETPVALCLPAEVLPMLASIETAIGRKVRLPSEDELLCALRGTDGRLDPAGDRTQTWWQSPWGLQPGGVRHEFCAVGIIIHRLATNDLTSSSPAQFDDAATALRPVILGE